MKSSELDAASCGTLTASIAGEVLFQETDGFEAARTAIWNLDSAGMPVVIVKCLNSEDVAKTITFAKQNKLGLCVHTAGAHSSNAVMDDCVVVDLSLLRSVTVDPSTRTATVQGGATIGDVDEACKSHGLALPMGHVHHTGVAGMVLNATSGVGFLCRNFKLTASHLVSATIVTSSGEVVVASSDSDSELLWGMRGAGANFGVAVEMVFSLEVVPPKIFAGDVVKFGKGCGPAPPLDSNETRGELALKFFEFFQSAPDECSALMVLAGQGPVISRLIYCPKKNDKSEEEIEREGKQAFEPLTSYGKIIGNETKMMNFWDEVQKLGQFPASYYYQKATPIGDLPPSDLADVVSKLSEYAGTCPVSNMGSGIVVQPFGGELKNLDPESTPTAEVFAKIKYWIIIMVNFPEGPKDPELRERCIQWVRDVHQVVEPFATKDNGRRRDYWSESVGDIYGESIPRLRELKRKYDPENVFSHNRNILPQ